MKQYRWVHKMKKDFLLSKTKENFTIDDNTFEIDDYTNNLDISDILKQYEGEFSEYQVSNDERIEVISYNIYCFNHFLKRRYIWISF